MMAVSGVSTYSSGGSGDLGQRGFSDLEGEQWIMMWILLSQAVD
jgi:hypothetical protein